MSSHEIHLSYLQASSLAKLALSVENPPLSAAGFSSIGPEYLEVRSAESPHFLVIDYVRKCC